ncbi:MAG TPA: pilus assembly protein N-terminal domain-containing protein [Roseiarcus sp.]|nr:pilus assembly protein N-terminal domain-containing protein [Roseiarcus sp.]
MSSRFWLALAFMVAFGSQPARAEASSEVLAITLDEAKIAKLPEGTSTLVVGNPMIADVTMLKTGGAMVITGKGYGETNLIALDPEGKVILERQLRVLPNKSVVVLQNGASRVSYSCNPDCMPTVQLGDDPKNFNDAGGEITSRNGLASGGVK